MPDEMAEAHARDYRNKQQIDTLRGTISDFLLEPPRLGNPALAALREAIRQLETESAHIVRRWA